MSDTVQQIKDKLTIVDVVSSYVKLTKAGKYHKGLSPFTKEKTPSFFVSPDRGLYHCFSSGKGGDMFTFIEEMEGVDFKGALKLLADKAGVPLVFEKSGARDQRERLYATLAEAAQFFEKALEEKKDALQYLVSRGFTEETISRWGLGYAPKEWRALTEHLETQQYTLAEIEEAGLAKRPEAAEQKKPYDRFRGRIMFPIRDITGRTIGFSGRIFEDDPTHPQAKYLNSPETPVFQKSKILYGVELARDGMRKYGFAILVEGQVDLLMAHQSGYTNAVALSGTSFTEEHAALIQRYVPNLVIAFDGDAAGVSAAGRAAAIALRAGLNVKIAAMPPGEDPADLIKRDASLWKGAIRDATHVVDFYLAYLKDSGFNERQFKLEVSEKVLPYVAAIENAIDQAHFVSRVAEALDAPEEAVRAELAKLATPRAPASDRPLEARAESFRSRGEMVERLLFGISRALADQNREAEAAAVEGDLEKISGKERLEALKGLGEADARTVLIEGDLFLERHGGERDFSEALADLISILKKEAVREKYRLALQRLKTAEREGDAAREKTLLNEITTLAKEL